ncbi:hypothetical protein F2Q69_00022551 [Brassica cretica]|uniref:Uncharacterized protein n=1 Tax=Brassica cretica TaxID=69181 RepID=A0A8S9Q9G0_BRACR|nr:hypothetical protein F2Q69_00022551 [Brassica cretica]
MKGDGYGLLLRAMGCYKDVFFCSTDTGSPCLVSRMDHRYNPCKQRIKDSICIKGVSVIHPVSYPDQKPWSIRRRAISLVSHINPHALIQIESLILCLQGLSKQLPAYKRSRELQPIQGHTRCQCKTEQLFKCNEVQSRTQITGLEQSTIVVLLPLQIGLES